jgi:hypothetical protein
MRRLPWLTALTFAGLGVLHLSPAAAQTLVLPLRTVGVSDTTAAVVGSLLEGELESRGIVIVPASQRARDLPTGDAACDDAVCAAAAGESHGASQVVYGSLSRLGEKIIFRIRALRSGDTAPSYMDQLTSTTEEDLDAVVRRAADGFVAGRANADRATLDTVTREETFEPRRRANRRGVGLRAGFIFPQGDSYGGVDRLTSVRLAFKYESRNYLIETTPILGFAWRGETIDWTILDLFGARIFGTGDVATYIGAGLGVHSVRVEKKFLNASPYDYYYDSSVSQGETTLTTDIGIGLMAFRTYDLSVIVDVRYHVVWADFSAVGGNGAHGIALTFGTSR